MLTLRRLSSLAVFCALASCVSSPRSDLSQWRKSEIAGLTMTLDDPVKEEWYSFDRGGLVSVTFGEKKGWLCSPLFLWKVQRGELIICQYDGKIFQTLRLVARDDRTFTAVNKSGKTVVFKILEKPERRRR